MEIGDSLLAFGDLLSLDSQGNIVTINGNLVVHGDISALTSNFQLLTSETASVSTLTVDTIYNKQLELLASQSAELKAQVASLSAILGLETGTPSATFDPSTFSSPKSTTMAADLPAQAGLPMTLEEYLATQGQQP